MLTYGELYHMCQKQYPQMMKNCIDYRPAALPNSLTLYFKFIPNFVLCVRYDEVLNTFVILDTTCSYLCNAEEVKS